MLQAIKINRYLMNQLTRRLTAFSTFEDMLDARGSYRPTIMPDTPFHLALADGYDAAQEQRGDPRRAFRAGIRCPVTWVVLDYGNHGESLGLEDGDGRVFRWHRPGTQHGGRGGAWGTNPVRDPRGVFTISGAEIDERFGLDPDARLPRGAALRRVPPR